MYLTSLIKLLLKLLKSTKMVWSCISLAQIWLNFFVFTVNSYFPRSIQNLPISSYSAVCIFLNTYYLVCPSMPEIMHFDKSLFNLLVMFPSFFCEFRGTFTSLELFFNKLYTKESPKSKKKLWVKRHAQVKSQLRFLQSCDLFFSLALNNSLWRLTTLIVVILC